MKTENLSQRVLFQFYRMRARRLRIEREGSNQRGECLDCPEKLAQPLPKMAEPNLPQPVAEIPWGNNIALLEKLKDPGVRLWYARQTVANVLCKERSRVIVEYTLRELPNEEIERIADTYHAWRGEPGAGGFEAYEDTSGFCKSATFEEIRSHGRVLIFARYVGAEAVKDEGEPFEEKIPHLVAQVNEQFTESQRLEEKIWSNLEALGYGG